jgi:hypothetical protein
VLVFAAIFEQLHEKDRCAHYARAAFDSRTQTTHNPPCIIRRQGSSQRAGRKKHLREPQRRAVPPRRVGAYAAPQRAMPTTRHNNTP